ncbi:hypothetical protein UK12_33615, partial [Saccharothrix sp. ST-888]
LHLGVVQAHRIVPVRCQLCCAERYLTVVRGRSRRPRRRGCGVLWRVGVRQGQGGVREVGVRQAGGDRPLAVGNLLSAAGMCGGDGVPRVQHANRLVDNTGLLAAHRTGTPVAEHTSTDSPTSH